MAVEREKALAKRAQIEKIVDPPEHVVLGKDFMLGHGYIKNDFDVHQWATPEFLDQAARELREEQWKKVTTSKLPETAASLASRITARAVRPPALSSGSACRLLASLNPEDNMHSGFYTYVIFSVLSYAGLGARRYERM